LINRIGSGSDSLTRRTTDALRQMIIEGTLHLGQVLSEAMVAQWLDVSRTPVREAFARLEIEGLLVSEPQRRTRVFMPGPKDVDDICVARECIENRAVILAIERHQSELAADLAKTAARMTEAMRSQDIPEYLRLDTEFHQSIFDHADNVFLCEAYRTIAPKLAALRTRLALHIDYLQKGYHEHLRLSELTASGDIERALVVLEEHISRKEDSFWRLNDGLVANETGRTHHGAGHDKALVTQAIPQQIDRRKTPPTAALKEDRNTKIYRRKEEGEGKESVSTKGRGRPRIHADATARKRVWAAREREKKKSQRLIMGQPPPKRGRPPKAVKPTQRKDTGSDAKH